jgi:hypothetical protein
VVLAPESCASTVWARLARAQTVLAMDADRR